MSRPYPIGILGGMGPETTVLLQQRLIAAVNATDDSDHIPLIVDMNSQVPSRIAHLIDTLDVLVMAIRDFSFNLSTGEASQ